jgi:hypothetical protein
MHGHYFDVSGVLHASTAYPPPHEKIPGINWIGGGRGWACPKTGLDEIDKWKFLTLPGLEAWSSVIQPVAIRYIDRAIRVLYEL